VKVVSTEVAHYYRSHAAGRRPIDFTGVTEFRDYRGRRDASTGFLRKERVLSAHQVREAVLR
jgi:hypothetical protein